MTVVTGLAWLPWSTLNYWVLQTVHSKGKQHTIRGVVIFFREHTDQRDIGRRNLFDTHKKMTFVWQPIICSERQLAVQSIRGWASLLPESLDCTLE